MRWIGILVVLAYRWLVRPWYRRVCLHPESCSAFAIRTLRTDGFARAVPRIRARLHACRMPAGACFVVDGGAPRLISATSATEAEVPPGALAVLAVEAAHAARRGS